MIRWIAALMVLPAVALAQDPPAAFYVGLYRIIGFDDAGPVDRHMRVDAVGDALTVSVCGTLASMTLPSPSGEDHYVNAVIGDLTLTCEPFSTYDNYPLLACYGDRDSVARLTLWPANDFAAPLLCVD